MMNRHFPIRAGQRNRKIAQALLALALAGGTGAGMAAVGQGTSTTAPAAGDGWQLLGSAVRSPASSAVATTQQVGTPPSAATDPSTTTTTGAGAAASPAGVAPGSLDVKQVVLPSAGQAEPTGTLSFSITPQNTNLRNALDRWLQTQGWQLAWKIDDDLPVEFNATFTGDFRSILTQVMQATDHMRTPARICRHTNNVIRVIARAANCKD